MKILALDSTALISTVALCEDDRLIVELTMNTGNTHSQTLLPMIEQVLCLSKNDICGIDLFACSTGPGSFTGVRIGTSTIKGLAFGKDKECVGVSTITALAYNLVGYEGIICPVMNARRGEVYNALFECKEQKITRLCQDRAISIEDLDTELSKFSGKQIFLCGDGYDITLEGLTKTKVGFTPLRLRHQSAYSVACCALEAYRNGEVVSDFELVPTYLRLSQAERERNEKLKI